MARNTSDFIESVKTTAMIPESQATITATRILAFADEEILTEMIPLIDSVNQEFFVVQENEAIVSGTDAYSIPYRAIGRKLRDLKMTDGNAVKNLTRVALEEAHLYNFSAEPAGYHFKGDKIIILPSPTTTGYTLQKFYMFRPSRLVETGSSGLITSISSNVLTLQSVPSNIVAGATVDLIDGKSGYCTFLYDQTVTNVSGLQVTLSAAPTGAANGDWISLAETTPLIQLPDEAFSYLVQRTAKRALEALGDTEGAAVIEKRLPQARKNLLLLLEPRNEGAGTKIIQRNGLLRSGRQLRYYRGINS